ncbi:MAG: hypothetical protein HYV95_10160 [Opitutae bacterium]|nr:hypothetical protein [Opitutae bacterium]
MTLRPDFRRAGASAFSLVELMVSATIVSFVTVGFLTYMRYAGISALNVTNQAVYNQQAGNAATLIVQRTRLCHSFSVQNSGGTLVIDIDDDPTTDSDGDGNLYNDPDHQETFQFSDADSDPATLTDNTLSYKPTATATAQLLARRISRIGGANYFAATSTKTVSLSFAVSGGDNSARGQRVEIISSASRLN